MPTVTRIAPTKRNPRRMSVYLDGQFAFAINQNVLGQVGLRVGDEVTPERVAEIEAGELRQEVFDAALQYVTRRPHSRLQLIQKLSRKDYPPAVIEPVLDRLQQLGYLDEQAFAEMLARKAINHHHGQRRAEMEMARAGLSRAMIRDAIERTYGQESSSAAASALAKKHWPRLSKLEPQVARRRLSGLLARRGYGHEDIAIAIHQLIGRNRDE